MTTRRPDYKKIARTIANATESAYSSDRFASWTAVAEMLLRRGYNVEETEEILRSKWTRWAADRSTKPHGKATAKDLAAFLDDTAERALLHGGPSLADQVRSLVATAV